MLRLMIADHPDISWLQEFEYSVDQVASPDNWPNVPSYLDWLSTHRIFRAMDFDVDRSLDYSQLVASFLEQKQRRDGAAVVGATVHRHFDRLLWLWRNAKFIHLVRDPRDVARSVKNIGWVGHIRYGADRWIQVEKLWDAIKPQLQPHTYVELRFEDVVADPERALRPVWELLGVDASRYRMSFWEHTTYDRPDPALTYQWKRKLRPGDVQLIEERVGPMLGARGYQPSAHPHVTPSRLREAYFRLANRAGRARFRAKRYGPLLWLASMVSQRLPFGNWSKSVRLKMNEIDTQHLK